MFFPPNFQTCCKFYLNLKNTFTILAYKTCCYVRAFRLSRLTFIQKACRKFENTFLANQSTELWTSVIRPPVIRISLLSGCNLEV